jgi:hypothetical protein
VDCPSDDEVGKVAVALGTERDERGAGAFSNSEQLGGGIAAYPLLCVLDVGFAQRCGPPSIEELPKFGEYLVDVDLHRGQ